MPQSRRRPASRCLSAVLLVLIWFQRDLHRSSFVAAPIRVRSLPRLLPHPRLLCRCKTNDVESDTATEESANESERPVFALPERATTGGESSGNFNGAGLQLPMSEKFGMAYTCGPCNTRNVIEVTRIAWNNGVVVATCRGCNVRHLLADSEGVLDLTNETNFRNVVDYMESKGESVMALDRNDAETLDSLGMKVDDNGKLKLVDDTIPPPPLEEILPADVEASTSAPAPEPTSVGATPAPSAPKEVEEFLAPSAPSAPKVEDVDAAPLLFPLPAGAVKGDVLQVKSDEFGLLYVPVPAGAFEGCRLEVQGMIAVGLGDTERWVQKEGQDDWEKTRGWKVGDVIAVNMPEASVARITISEGALKDPTLQIGYPVGVMAVRSSNVG